jgi:hypothetical protein
VIAIGVPTVVDAATMANDAIDLVLDSMIEQAPRGYGFLQNAENHRQGRKTYDDTGGAGAVRRKPGGYAKGN